MNVTPTATASATQRKPQTLDAYVQVAIEETQRGSKRSRRRRKKQQQEASPQLQSTVQVKPPALPTPPAPAKPKRRKRRSKLKNSVLQNRKIAPSCKFRVRGLVTIDELEDEDEAEELLEEIRVDFGRFGELEDVAIITEEGDGDLLVGDVVVESKDEASAFSAFSAYDGKMFGGKKVTCIWEVQSDGEKNFVVVVNGVVTPEELEDPDEVEDVEEEMMQISTKYGEVKKLRLSETTGQVTVVFDDERDAQKVQEMNGSRYSGREVTARLKYLSREIRAEGESVKCPPETETKRFVTPIIQPTKSPELQDLVVALLKRLAALQERAHTQNKATKRSRRLVLGMHEVRRGLLCNKIVLLVMATDLDGCEAVEEKYVELVAIATEHEVPVLAPMNRRKLGRVVQKNVRVSCVGVYSVEGANDLFQQILQKMKTTTPR